MPSAGRAFTPELITRLTAQGVQVAPLVLHTGVASLEDLIGRSELLRPRAVTLAKTGALDLSCLLDPIPAAADRSWLRHDTSAHGNGPILEDTLLADAGFTDVDRSIVGDIFTVITARKA